MKRLTYLSLNWGVANNRIHTLPDEIFDLENLETLLVGDCFTHLSSNILKLENIKKIYITKKTTIDFLLEDWLAIGIIEYTDSRDEALKFASGQIGF